MERIREKGNRYWTTERVDNGTVGKLHFKQFYDDEIILEFQVKDSKPNEYYYNSKRLGIEQNVRKSQAGEYLNEIMEHLENRVIETIQNEIIMSEDMLEKFEGKNPGQNK